MSDLEPNTRAENFWVNEGDLEPITRKEQYIKHLYDETQVTPEYPKTREEYFINKAGEELHDVTIEQLNVTENGTYSEAGKAYSPVIVEVPEPTLISKSITQNGTYTASSDNADGYSSVDVHVSGYKITDVSGLPSAIASFSDGSSLPMPKLEVAIEPIQEGSGDPSPENIRPISGFSAVNVVDMDDITNKAFFDGLLNGTYGVVDLGSKNWVEDNSRFNTESPLSDAKRGNWIKCICAIYVTDSGVISRTTDKTIGIANNGYVYIYDTHYTDATTFKQAMSGVHLIYELETPTTPTITPTEFNNLLTEFGINGSIYRTTLKDSQGNPLTCYGGELSNENGVQTLENARGHVVYDGSNDEPWGNYSSNYNGFGIIISGSNIDATNPSTQLMCDKLAVSTVRGPSGEKPIKTYTSTSDNNAIFVSIEGITDKADFLTYLSNNNIEITYPLATPQTIPQDNLAIASQDGTNNMWADSGDVVEASYFESL